MAKKRKRDSVAAAKSQLGHCVIAKRRFRTGDEIAEIQGTIIDDASYGSCYCMDFGDGQGLEPDAPFRFLNHSCDPNCELVHWADEETDEYLHLALVARRAIQPNEELTIDYGWAAENAIPCLCGSASCRGWIVAEDELHLLATAAR
jgi:hypothetical protein